MINILKKIHEPSSSISDLILSLFCFYWFYDLTTIFFYNKSNTLFFSLIIFFILGISALLGSFFHMFAKIISNKLIGFNFKIAVFTIGLILLLFSFLYIDLLLKNNLKFVIGSFFSLTIIFFYYQFLKTKKKCFRNNFITHFTFYWIRSLVSING